MKKIGLGLLKCAIALSVCVFVIGCKSNEPVIPDPEGTVTVSMKNCHYECTKVTPVGCEGDFSIDYNNNFGGSLTGSYFFLDVGEVKGIGEISQIPDKPFTYWNMSVELKKGHGYIGVNMVGNSLSVSVTYFLIYIEDLIKGSNGDIIGAIVKYHTPKFKPETSSINVSDNEVLFPLYSGGDYGQKQIVIAPLNSWKAVSTELFPIYTSNINSFMIERPYCCGPDQNVDDYRGKTGTVTISMDGLTDKKVTVKLADK